MKEYIALRIKISSIRIQMLAKKYSKRIQERQRLAERSASTLIVKNWKSYKEYWNYLAILASIILLQKTTRLWIQRRKRERKKRKNYESDDGMIQTAKQAKHNPMEHLSATLISKTWRSYNLCWNHLALIKGVILIQSVTRSFLARTELLDRELGAITIQACFRGYFVREMLVEWVVVEENGGGLLGLGKWVKGIDVTVINK